MCKRFATLAKTDQIATVEMQTPLMSDQVSSVCKTPCQCHALRLSYDGHRDLVHSRQSSEESCRHGMIHTAVR